MDKKNHTFFFRESPFSHPWDKNFHWEQQNSLIGGYGIPKTKVKKIYSEGARKCPFGLD